MIRLIVRAALLLMLFWLVCAAVAFAAAPPTDEIAYISTISGQYQAYRLDAQRGLIYRLRTGRDSVMRLAWSPDGAHLALTICGPSADIRLCSIYLTDAFGGERRLLIEGAMAFGWSPDGGSLLYQGMFPNNTLYRLDFATGARTGLIDFDPNTSAPSLSPDGRLIALTQMHLTPISRTPRLFRASAESFDVAPLTDHTAMDLDPVWSPDGSRISFLATPDFFVHTDLFVVNADGSDLLRVTRSGRALYHTWLGDSNRLVFVENERRRLIIADLDQRRFEALDNRAAAFAPVLSGDNLYYVGDDLRLYRLYLPTRQATPVTAQRIFASNEGGRVLQRRPGL